MSTNLSLNFRVKSPGVIIASNGIGHEQEWCILTTTAKGGYVIIAPPKSKFAALSGKMYFNYKLAKQAVLDHWCNINKIQTLVEVPS